MKKLFSVAIPASLLNLALLIMRLGIGALMLPHGYDKLVHFTMYKTQFMSFMGLSLSMSLCLSIFAEFFASIFLMLGLATRFMAFVLTVNMCVALFTAHAGDIFGKGQAAALFLLPYVLLLLTGAGKFSIDNLITGSKPKSKY